MIEAIKNYLSIPENAKGLLSVSLSVVVILAVTGMLVTNPTVLNYVLGAGVMCSSLVLTKTK